MKILQNVREGNQTFYEGKMSSFWIGFEITFFFGFQTPQAMNFWKSLNSSINRLLFVVIVFKKPFTIKNVFVDDTIEKS